MRPSQNKRMRGRNNTRKGPNPLSRTYESNGPDVKIRGTAHHVGEKYLQLARDAQSSGDPVMAESYLQHAEHYFRLIAAAQQAQQAAFSLNRQPGEAEAEELEEDDDFSPVHDRFASPVERLPPPAQQPFAAQPQQYSAPERERPVYTNGERPNYERQERGGRQDRNSQDRNSQDRNSDRNLERAGPDRNSQDRNSQERNSQDRNSQDRGYQDKRPPRDNDGRNSDGRNPRNGRGGPREFRQDFRQDYRQDNRQEPRLDRNEAHAPAEELENPGHLPAFITAPVRIQPETHVVGAQDERLAEDFIERPDAEAEATGFHLRPRRRRRPKLDIGIGEGPGETATATDPIGD
jgi:hypothetical protein